MSLAGNTVGVSGPKNGIALATRFVFKGPPTVAAPINHGFAQTRTI
jgi:hypothetical protein